MAVKLMKDLSLSGKRVLIREDLNVPIKDGVVSSDARIRAALPTIRWAVDAGANAASRVGELVSSHILARPHSELLTAFVDVPKAKA